MKADLKTVVSKTNYKYEPIDYYFIMKSNFKYDV